VIAEKNQSDHEMVMIIFYAGLLLFGVGCAYNYLTSTLNIKQKLPARFQSICDAIIGLSGFVTLLFGFALLGEKFQIQF